MEEGAISHGALPRKKWNERTSAGRSGGAAVCQALSEALALVLPLLLKPAEGEGGQQRTRRFKQEFPRCLVHAKGRAAETLGLQLTTTAIILHLLLRIKNQWRLV